MKNNGKASERAVKQALDALKEEDWFDYQRMYDATSAQNPFVSQVGDFQFFMPGIHGVIEVKSTKHSYRLGRPAFSSNQLPRLVKRAKSGGRVWVLVNHHQEGFWRALPLQLITEAFIDKSQASIDMRGLPIYTSAATALQFVIEQSLDKEDPV